jgi:hypothetical protein
MGELELRAANSGRQHDMTSSSQAAANAGMPKAP